MIKKIWRKIKKHPIVFLLIPAVVFAVLAWLEFRGEIHSVLNKETVEWNRFLKTRIMAGVSLGFFLLVLIVVLLPVLFRQTDKSLYKGELFQGLLSAAVFYSLTKSIELYKDKNYVIYALGIAFIAWLFLFSFNYILSRFTHRERVRELRTKIIASVSGGLLFGILVQIGSYTFDSAKDALNEQQRSIGKTINKQIKVIKKKLK